MTDMGELGERKLSPRSTRGDRRPGRVTRRPGPWREARPQDDGVCVSDAPWSRFLLNVHMTSTSFLLPSPVWTPGRQPRAHREVQGTAQGEEEEQGPDRWAPPLSPEGPCRPAAGAVALGSC